MAELRISLSRLLCVLFLCCLLFFGFSTHVFADTEGSQNVTVTVPCTVSLEIGNHGSVSIDGTTYNGKTTIQREMDTILTYIITPDSGYEISKLTYDGVDVTSEVKNNSYMATALKDDVTVSVSFVKQASHVIPKTGEESRIGLGVLLICASVILFAITLARATSERRI